MYRKKNELIECAHKAEQRICVINSCCCHSISIHGILATLYYTQYIGFVLQEQVFDVKEHKKNKKKIHELIFKNTFIAYWSMIWYMP